MTRPPIEEILESGSGDPMLRNLCDYALSLEERLREIEKICDESWIHDFPTYRVLEHARSTKDEAKEG